MNTVDELVESLTPDMVNELKRAIELGKFPDNRAVSDQQRELMIEATILYDALKLPEEERTGFIHRKKQASGVLNVVPNIIPSKDTGND
ncbi:MAG: DUF1315 family protein [Oceanospirillales bacterium TMED33]|nr:hypothetical protein [Gammaproteobacteria bacterium]RPG21406.1 MAG: DUF1315 family protein [Oceanospirillales bacterium TMED33]CAI8355261.1 MAG: Uncharacterised protein [Gammaproteobacteria bacterium]|tara:strand:- start:328 stop:594 length:267 start_codon:yes stop_codon:yes gene_type:complete